MQGFTYDEGIISLQGYDQLQRATGEDHLIIPIKPNGHDYAITYHPVPAPRNDLEEEIYQDLALAKDGKTIRLLDDLKRLQEKGLINPYVRFTKEHALPRPFTIQNPSTSYKNDPFLYVQALMDKKMEHYPFAGWHRDHTYPRLITREEGIVKGTSGATLQEGLSRLLTLYNYDLKKFKKEGRKKPKKSWQRP